MKTIIMAGGEGRRLRPVTGDLPKPLAPLLGRPLLEHIILLLKKHGFTDICAAVKYRAEDIIERMGDGSSLGVRLQYRVEDRPLGTAGGVKNCADFYGDEDFLVISGDAACDFDLSALAEAHRKSGAAVTLALYRQAEPLSLGLAVTDREGFVRSFIEKPAWGRVVTDLVNTGIYIVSPRAMEQVPLGLPFDFAKDLFPLLMDQGERLLGVPMEGYWCDAGTPLAYYRCCVDALEGRLRLEPGEGFLPAPAAARSAPAAGEGPGEARRWDRVLELGCRSRAALMGALSAAFMDLGADYSDGLRLRGRRYEARVSPLPERSAVGVSVSAEDAEFAGELSAGLKEMIEGLDL